MSSSAYEPVGSDNEGDYRGALAPKHSTQGLVEEYELSSRDAGYDRPEKTDAIWKTRHYKSEPRPVRGLFSGSVLLQATLDFLLILPALYFLVFGFIVYSRDGSPLDGDGENSSLVEAAALGPTIFPIAFAAVVGRFLKSAAAWKLERQGASVGTLEQLLSSKTVISAVTLPFSLRLFNALTVPLIVLWALSPIGGQASRRVISTGPMVSNSYTNVSYLDSNSQFRMGGLWSGSTNNTEWPTYTAAYVGALVAPPAIKDSAQDVFSHFKIPMIEYIEAASPRRDDTFVPVTDYSKVAWSALLGIPMSLVNSSSSNASLSTAANTTFHVESSYWNLDCADLALRDYYANPAAHTEGGSASFANFSKAPYEHVRSVDDGSGIHLGLQKHSRNSTGPRIIYWESLTGGGITHTECKLTTTYVESQVTCQGTSCTVTAIRRSLNPYTPSNLSMLDYQIALFEDWQFFFNWLWGTPSIDSSVWANANQVYFTNPAAPFMVEDVLSTGPPDIATSISTKTFNQRFSQLLNTAWLASIASSGLTTGYVPTSRLDPPWRPGPGTAYTIPSPGAYYMSKYTTATEQREHSVIFCERAWLAVLVVSSLAMLAAGVGGMVLEAGRRGPDVLTAFSSLIRDNRFFNAQSTGSMLDGFELTRVLAQERVRLGDAARENELGYVAIGVADGKGAVSRLQTGRMYA